MRRHWHAFHNAWATFIASHLNQQLPAGFFAEPNVQFGIEIDVATFEESTQPGPCSAGERATTLWTPPPPTLTIPLPIVTDIIEIAVFGTEGGPELAGAIELVSPANKDRPEHRGAFAQKCSNYLQHGIGLVVVDVVTSRTGNMHELILLQFEHRHPIAGNPELYASAYRPVERSGTTSLDIWYEPVAVGQHLPTMPFWLRGGQCFAVDFDATYERTCTEQRLEKSPT
jgi:hypothetical protein